jgi:hypothetical protein
MTAFPTAAHLVSWAKFSPIDAKSAGRKKGNSTGSGNPWLADALGEVVAGLARTNTFLGERYRRLVRRRGKKRAIVAVGNSLLTIIWHLLSDPNTRHQDLGPGYHESRINQQRRQRDLSARSNTSPAARSTFNPHQTHPPPPGATRPRARRRCATPGATACPLTHRFSNQPSPVVGAADFPSGDSRPAARPREPLCRTTNKTAFAPIP